MLDSPLLQSRVHELVGFYCGVINASRQHFHVRTEPWKWMHSIVIVFESGHYDGRSEAHRWQQETCSKFYDFVVGVDQRKEIFFDIFDMGFIIVHS